MRRFEQFRGECAIKTVAERQRSFFRSQPQAPRLRKQTSNDVFIFFRLKAACAVNQYATGLKELERSAGTMCMCDGTAGSSSCPTACVGTQTCTAGSFDA